MSSENSRARRNRRRFICTKNKLIKRFQKDDIMKLYNVMIKPSNVMKKSMHILNFSLSFDYSITDLRRKVFGHQNRLKAKLGISIFDKMTK